MGASRHSNGEVATIEIARVAVQNDFNFFNAHQREAALRFMTITPLFTLLVLTACSGLLRAERPNILLAISDDQSFAHTSATGCKAISTPAFDQVARSGVLLTQAFCGSPGCSPSRASLLTGRYPWQIEHAGTHASSFPAKFAVYPELLEDAGYFTGYTGKGWGPGNFKVSGRTRNPAGRAFSQIKLAKDVPRPGGASRTDYAANFAAFLKQRPAGTPFCFWYGGFEPHRGFEAGSGAKWAKDKAAKLAAVQVPAFLPDTIEIRNDILDYLLEIEHFDHHLQLMLKQLKDAGELENTLVIVTSDNGMSFPAAKANCFEYGIHMPMAISWPKKIPAGGECAELISFTDLAPTILHAAGVKQHKQMVGDNLLPLLTSKRRQHERLGRAAVYSGRERHSSSRFGNLAYPQRAIRTAKYLLIRNFRPDRWPAGAPQKYAGDKLGPMHGGYHDIDACPTLTFMINNREKPAIAPYFHNAVDKRPAVELYDIAADPGCMKNLAGDEKMAEIKAALQKQLEQFLHETADPRIIDGGDIFETYRRYSAIRRFPKPE